MNPKENETGYTFEIHSLLRDLLRNLWVIVLAGLIGLMGVFIYNNNTYTPMYTSTATLLANVKTGAAQSYTTLSASTELATIFSEVFVQPTMKKNAAAHLGMNSFSGSISSSALSKTNIFTVSVTTTSPELAYTELCAVLEVYPQISDAIFADAVIEIMRSPTVPKTPSNAVTPAYRTIAVFVCMALAAGIIAFLSLTRDTVKDEASFRKKIGAKLVGTVVHERRHQSLKSLLMGEKKSLLINSAYASFRFTESYQKLANKLEYMQRKNASKLFLITSIAENEGKSTTAANIAIALASRGNSVLLLDMDFKKPAMHKIFDIQVPPNQDFGALLARQIPHEEFKFHKYRRSNLYTALNAGRHSDYVDWIHSDHVAGILRVFRQHFSYILIDTPPISAAADVSSLARLADQTLLVVKTDCAYAADINDAILTLSSGCRFAGCILNDVPPEFTLLGQIGADESGYAGHYYSYYGSYGKYSRRGSYGKYGSYNRTISEELMTDLPEETEKSMQSSTETVKK